MELNFKPAFHYIAPRFKSLLKLSVSVLEEGRII